ncbi:MAG TPA: xanthine dehydrogenase family protein subunit M [Bryobacteraceae bacterium]|nr:xanthine dehydrogenase family protein subunit M [Bryobacteraceae bacterium]
MIAQEFEYSSTTQLKEALALMADGAKPLAGGMSLVPMMKLRLATPEHVVDIRRIHGLRFIEEAGDRVRIGSTSSHHDIESSAVLHRVSPLLAKTAACIGDVQVRNMGTIGGSVAHNDPAADYMAALFALDAEVSIASATGERTLGIGDFILDPFTTALDTGELIREISIPVEVAGTSVAYVKMSQPASGFAIVGVAVRVRRAADGTIGFIRIGVTGVGPIAYRAASAEAKLQGTSGSDADIAAAASVMADSIDATSDMNATAEYRKHLAGAHGARAIRTALADISAGRA